MNAAQIEVGSFAPRLARIAGTEPSSRTLKALAESAIADLWNSTQYEGAARTYVDLAARTLSPEQHGTFSDSVQHALNMRRFAHSIGFNPESSSWGRLQVSMASFALERIAKHAGVPARAVLLEKKVRFTDGDMLDFTLKVSFAGDAATCRRAPVTARVVKADDTCHVSLIERGKPAQTWSSPIV